MSNARRIDSMMFDNGIRGDQGSVEFEFETYYRQDRTIEPFSIDPQRDLLSYFDPPRMEHILKTNPRQFYLFERVELRHTVVTSDTQYTFTIHTSYINQRYIRPVRIIVSGIMEHPDNGDSRFIQRNNGPVAGEKEYRRFMDLVKFEYQLSNDSGMLSALAAGHKSLLNRLKLKDNYDHTTAMISALAAGQHQRLGEASPIIALRSDVLRVLVDVAFPRILDHHTMFMRNADLMITAFAAGKHEQLDEHSPPSKCSDIINFLPSPGSDFEIMKEEVLEMRAELAKLFKIIEVTVQDEYEFEDCRIKEEHVRDFTGFGSFVVFLKLLEERLTPEDKARIAYDEITPPMNLEYGSDKMRIYRILNVDGNRDMEEKIAISLNTRVFDEAVARFDGLFNATQSSFKEGWNNEHERLITVNGYDYKVIMVYAENPRDWEEDSAYCHIYGIYESTGTYAEPGDFSGIDTFNFFMDLLAADLTDEDRDRPRLPHVDYPRLSPSDWDEEDDGDN